MVITSMNTRDNKKKSLYGAYFFEKFFSKWVTACAGITALFLFFFTTPSMAASSQKFIIISDIHFDPFIGCETQLAPCPLIQALQKAPVNDWEAIFKQYHVVDTITYKQDSSNLLLDSTVEELQKHASDHPTFAILLGDTLAHRFDDKYKTYAENSSMSFDDFTNKTIDFVAQKLEAALPDIPIYPVIGNNDGDTGHYDVTPHGDFLSHMADSFSSHISDATFHDAFSNAGFYAISLSPHQRLIVLNSVLFSTLQPNSPAMDIAANEEITWLKDQLILAHQQNQFVLIAMHIPIGIDVFKTFGPLYSLQDPNFWKTTYTQSFLDILQKSPAHIIAILTAHLHTDTFQIIQDANNPPIPVIFTPAISPVYGNNPSFKSMTLSDTNGLTDFDTYFYPLNQSKPRWEKEYNFNNTYQPDCQSCQIIDGLQKITPDQTIYYDAYKKYLFASSPGDKFSVDQWQANQCSITQFDTASYHCCFAGSHHSLLGLLKQLF